MCNEDCNEHKPCCLCQYNQSPYKCNAVKCGEDADFCEQKIAEQNAEAVWEAKHEIPEPPYNYVEIEE